MLLAQALLLIILLLKDVDAQLDLLKLEVNVLKHVKMINSLMKTDYVIHAQFMKLSSITNVYVNQTMLETLKQEDANLLVQLVNLNIKEDVLNAHLIFNTEAKLEVVLAVMDYI